jgi:methyl-accepting chemotaxis protein
MRIVTKVAISILTVTLVSALAGGLIAWSSFSNIRAEMYKWFDQSAETLASSIGKRSTELIYYFDFDAITGILESEGASDENLEYAEVRFGEGLDESRSYGDKDVLPFREYVYDVVENEEKIARVTIHYSPKVVEAKLSALVTRLSTGVLLTLVVLITVLSALIVYMVNRPLKSLISYTEQIAEGDLTVTVKTGTSDEFGQLADVFNQMTANLRDMVSSIGSTFSGLQAVAQDVSHISRELSDGSNRQADAVGNVSASIEEMNVTIRTVARNVDEMSMAAEENSSSVLEIGASIDEVAKNSESLSSSVEQTSSSINEMNASIQGVSKNVNELSSTVNELTSSIAETDQSIKEVEERASESFKLSEDVSRSVASDGIQSVNRAVSGITDIKEIVDTAASVIRNLDEKTGDIGNIIGLINDVNDQTSLLALNAAIIAAQAGEHGRSFAVVASEIRELSDRTAESTKDIANLISGVQDETKNAVQVVDQGAVKVDEGVRQIEDVRITLEGVREATAKASDESRAIAQTTTEQATAIKQVMEMAQDMSERFQSITDATREQSLGSEQIIDAAENMRNLAVHVTTATAEQTRGITGIGQASEKTQQMSRTIQEATREEAKSSELILNNMQEIKNINENNVDMVKSLDSMVHTLSAESGQLREEINRFKVMKEEDE